MLLVGWPSNHLGQGVERACMTTSRPSCAAYATYISTNATAPIAGGELRQELGQSTHLAIYVLRNFKESRQAGWRERSTLDVILHASNREG